MRQDAVPPCHTLRMAFGPRGMTRQSSRPRWARGLAVLAVACVGCGGQKTSGDTSPISAGDASVEDTSPTAHGDASARDDGDPSDVSHAGDAISPVDGAPASDRGIGTISEEEWQRRIAPLEGEHDVDRHVSYGCPAQPIAQDFRVMPTVACRVRPGSTTVRDCDVEPFCSRHEQCQDKPFGRCRGSPSARCVYPVERVACAAASDCTAMPNGSCPPTIPATPQTLCYPTGRCETTQRRCVYRDEPCTSDADCTTVAGGVCEKRIGSIRCEYQACMIDSDCAQGSRCVCAVSGSGNVCVPADCQTDGDCGTGQECRLELGCHGMPHGYHCSTLLDTCKTKGDCGPDYCLFNGSWQCVPKFCPVGP